MSVNIGWEEISLRLALTALAGALIGINRSERGRAAGLRTNVLVCMAASVSMIQVNLLLGLTGKHPDSFIVMDLMRLPLGILTGMGFIGGGAILRRGNLVTGVTTAATLWFVTVMGLCFGGGQLGLGLAALAIGLVVLYVLRWFEDIMPEDRSATLVLSVRNDGPDERQIRADIAAAHLNIVSFSVTYAASARLRKIDCRVQWHGRADDTSTPEIVRRLGDMPGVARLQWRE